MLPTEFKECNFTFNKPQGMTGRRVSTAPSIQRQGFYRRAGNYFVLEVLKGRFGRD
jgi:hypothetical protein